MRISVQWLLSLADIIIISACQLEDLEAKMLAWKRRSVFFNYNRCVLLGTSKESRDVLERSNKGATDVRGRRR